MRDTRFFRALLDSAAHAVIATDEHGLIVEFNRGAEQLTGYSRAEVLGRPPPDAIHRRDEIVARSLALSAELGETVTPSFETIVAKARRGLVDQHEWTYVRKDGIEVPVRLSVTAVRDDDGQLTGFLGIAEDITALVEARRAAADERRGRDRVFDLSLDLIVIIDVTGHILAVNPAWRATLGLAPDRLVGHVYGQHIVPADRRRSVREFERLTSGGDATRSFQVRMIHDDGSTRWVEWNAVYDADTGRVLALGRDVTEQHEFQRALLDAKGHAEAASRAKSAFLANMSHELRTPLNAVLGFSQVLLKNKEQHLGATDLEYLSRVRANGLHLLDLINNVLDLSKVEAGTLERNIEFVDLRDVIETTVGSLVMQAESRGCQLSATFPDEELFVRAEPAALRQVLDNLVSNALKFAAGGAVELAVCADGGHVRRIDVIDNGIGIAPDKLGVIFEEFRQADESTSRRFGGTGLGLPIAKSLCETMGFALEVDSAPGLGSVFSVVLDPAAADPVRWRPPTHSGADAATP